MRYLISGLFSIGNPPNVSNFLKINPQSGSNTINDCVRPARWIYLSHVTATRFHQPEKLSNDYQEEYKKEDLVHSGPLKDFVVPPGRNPDSVLLCCSSKVNDLWGFSNNISFDIVDNIAFFPWTIAVWRQRIFF